MMGHLKEMSVWMPLVLKYYWYTCWSIISPAILLTVFVVAWTYYTPVAFEGYVFPPGVQFMAWGLELYAFTIAIIFLIHAYISRALKGKDVGFKKMFLEATPLWGPRKEE